MLILDLDHRGIEEKRALAKTRQQWFEKTVDLELEFGSWLCCLLAAWAWTHSSPSWASSVQRETTGCYFFGCYISRTLQSTNHSHFKASMEKLCDSGNGAARAWFSFLSVWTWAGLLTSLSLSVHICRKVIIIPSLAIPRLAGLL